MSAHGDVKEEERCKYCGKDRTIRRGAIQVCLTCADLIFVLNKFTDEHVVMRIAKDVGFFHSERD
jgi:hypothetical protein